MSKHVRKQSSQFFSKTLRKTGSGFRFPDRVDDRNPKQSTPTRNLPPKIRRHNHGIVNLQCQVVKQPAFFILGRPGLELGVLPVVEVSSALLGNSLRSPRLFTSTHRAGRAKIMVFFPLAPYRTLDSARLGDGSLRSKFFVEKSS
jgi:hypothetical protein